MKLNMEVFAMKENICRKDSQSAEIIQFPKANECGARRLQRALQKLQNAVAEQDMTVKEFRNHISDLKVAINNLDGKIGALKKAVQNINHKRLAESSRRLVKTASSLPG